MKARIVVAHGYTSIEAFNTLHPLLLASITKEQDIRFINYAVHDVGQMSGDILILVRKYQKVGISLASIHDEIDRLRKRFCRIVYFDDSAAVSYIMFGVAEIVDQYWVRGVHKDLKSYEIGLYGGRLYTDYYNKQSNIHDQFPTLSPCTKSFPSDKVRIAWNIGIGCYPYSQDGSLSRYYMSIRKACGALSLFSAKGIVTRVAEKYRGGIVKALQQPVSLECSDKRVNARFGFSRYTETVGYQRKCILDKIVRTDGYECKSLPFKHYLECMSRDSAVLSPFGWGEICYRDYEAAIFGKLLIKPNMAHIETWPDIYTDDCYLSIGWDVAEISFADLVEEQGRRCQREKVLSARTKYLEAWESLDKRVNHLITGIK